MLTVVFETVEVLVALAAHLTAIGFLFLHADGSRIWDRGCRINNGIGAVWVLLELLVLVTML